MTGPLIKRYTEDIEAYSLYLKGRHQLFNFTMESMAKSRNCFEEAINMDPNYTLAWHGLALYYWWMGYLGFMPPRDAQVQCNGATAKALEL